MRERSRRIADRSSFCIAGNPVRSPATGRLSSAGKDSDDPRIWKLWDKWAPLLLTRGVRMEDLDRIREEYRAWLTGLLRDGVTIRRIERLGLDDPRLSGTDRIALLEMLKS